MEIGLGDGVAVLTTCSTARVSSVWPCLLPDLAASSSNKPQLFRVTDTATKPGMPGRFTKHIIAWVALAQELMDVKDRIRAHGLARAASAPDSLVHVVEHEKPPVRAACLVAPHLSSTGPRKTLL